MGRSGMEYLRGSLGLELDAEALATDGFVLYPGALPDGERERVPGDVTRAWRWAGFDVEVLRS